LNRIRFGIFFSSWVVAACSIAGANSGMIEKEETQVVYAIATLVIGFASIPVGYFLNMFYVKFVCNRHFARLQVELQMDKYSNMGEAKLHRSQLSLIYQNVQEVLATKAKDHKVSVYNDPYWAEICARFIRESYLNDKAVTLTLQLFEVAFEQYPKSAHLHLMYLEYVKEFLPQVSEYKMKHIKFLNKRCSYVGYRFLITFINNLA
jgi:hypothetical protein